MSWVQPKFTDFLIPQSKRQKIQSENVNKTIKKIDIKSDGTLRLINKWKPKKKTDLVIQKKKIDELECWLQETKKKSGSSFLLMYGPPGCGKLTTLKVLCSENDFNLVEWIPQVALTSFNPDSISHVPYQSEISVFEDFILRSTRYSNVLNRNSSRLVVIKDIPTRFTKDPNLFHDFLNKFVEMDGMNLVFIVTEYKITKDLFYEDIKQKFNIRTIQFNPVTQRNTLLVLQKIANDKFLQYLDSISLSSGGDLRNAIMTLQFLSVKGVLPHKKKEPLSANSKSDSIDLFHAMGRVLYAKREDNKLKHCPIDVADSFISTPDLFINMLHENYLMTFSSIHEIAKSSNCLMESDLLLHPLESSASLSLVLTTYGLMSSNSNPIKKFQQFNRPTRICDNLTEYRYICKDTESLIDVTSYGRFIPAFRKLHKGMFTKLKPFGESTTVS